MPGSSGFACLFLRKVSSARPGWDGVLLGLMQLCSWPVVLEDSGDRCVIVKQRKIPWVFIVNGNASMIYWECPFTNRGVIFYETWKPQQAWFTFNKYCVSFIWCVMLRSPFELKKCFLPLQNMMDLKIFGAVIRKKCSNLAKSLVCFACTVIFNGLTLSF